jgi:predicted acetyltransferase
MLSITLHPAQRDELECIENLMQFYTYDFSEWLALEFGSQGFFSIQPTTDYWRKPATQPFLILVDGEIAGFVTVDDDVRFDDVQYNIGYFFVGRRYRGRGVGKSVVSMLLERFPGQWQIFHIDANQPARGFWARVIPALTEDKFSRHQLTVEGHECTLFKFAFSAAPKA